LYVRKWGIIQMNVTKKKLRRHQIRNFLVLQEDEYHSRSEEEGSRMEDTVTTLATMTSRR